VGHPRRVGRAVARDHRSRAALADAAGVSRWHLSITHTDLVAIAYVVAST
jgi:phosphopantetheinyl transferase (holo-ACP synthase)